MAYKGADLDLRLARPAPWREATGVAEPGFDSASGWPAPGGAHPIAVDELLLACCNRAFDVAQFHGAGEVRLEHLLHALTRSAATAEVLRELGIRADVLRRETAVAIASDMPAGAPDRVGSPRVSAALADALRRAAGDAERRLLPAGVHDLLRALLGAGPESPAAHLLLRAAADPQRLERWRDEPRREALATLPVGHALARSEDVRSPVGDALLDRLDRMEASLRGLREDAAADRTATDDLMRTLQAELQAYRAQGARAPAADRSEAVDAVLEAKLGEFGGAMAALAGRLGAIDKLAAGDNWQALGARLEAVEGHFAAQTSELAGTLASTLSEHFDHTEARWQRLQEDADQRWRTAEGRQIALEAALRAQLEVAAEAGKARERELGEVYEALLRLGTSQQEFSDMLTGWRAESGGDIGIVSNFLQQLEETLLDLLERLNGEVQALRQEQLEYGERRGNGFKRWLYGTGHVFATGGRDAAASIPPTHDRPPSAEKS